MNREEIPEKSRKEHTFHDVRVEYIGLKGAKHTMGLLVTTTSFANFAAA